MKKFITLLLTICMLLSTFTFSAVAAGQTEQEMTDRAIKLYVEEDILNTESNNYETVAKKTVTITVKIEGRNDLASAVYDITYEPALFKYVSSATKDGNAREVFAHKEEDGRIRELFYIDGSSTFADGEILATYTFEAIPQEFEDIGTFKIENAISSTWDEAPNPITYLAQTNEEDVTIKLIEYTVTPWLDTTEYPETQAEDAIAFDNTPHTFKVVTDPAATVKYTLNGVGIVGDEVVIDPQDTYQIEEYVITWEVQNPDGYAPKNGTFTVKITKPEFYVEVAENYVFGKHIVLVHTNEDMIHFSYGQADHEMIDVSNNENYIYEGTKYLNVYAFVTDPIENGTKDDYEEEVIIWYEGSYDDIAVGEYNADLNYGGTNEINDITFAFGIANTRPSYYVGDTYQKNILKLDKDGNKFIDGADTGIVVSEVKNALGLN